MCKVCDKEVYFEKSWSYHDVGYGDTDYGGVSINELQAIICPACGKVKPYGIEKFGSIENVLTHILLINLSNSLNSDIMTEKFKSLLSSYGKTNLELILKQNNLIYKDSRLEHSCGHILLTGVKNIDNVDVLSNIFSKKGFNFCPRCGEKLLPLNTVIRDKTEVIYHEVDSRKTWDRSE